MHSDRLIDPVISPTERSSQGIKHSRYDYDTKKKGLSFLSPWFRPATLTPGSNTHNILMAQFDEQSLANVLIGDYIVV